MTADSVYALTHGLMYVTDFGQRPLPAGVDQGERVRHVLGHVQAGAVGRDGEAGGISGSGGVGRLGGEHDAVGQGGAVIGPGVAVDHVLVCARGEQRAAVRAEGEAQEGGGLG